MNKKQRKSAAKYLYDISKGTLLLLVIGGFAAPKKFDLTGFALGSLITGLTFFIAFHLEKERRQK